MIPLDCTAGIYRRIYAVQMLKLRFLELDPYFGTERNHVRIYRDSPRGF